MLIVEVFLLFVAAIVCCHNRYLCFCHIKTSRLVAAFCVSVIVIVIVIVVG
jgi:hypothetical protein